MSIDVTGADLEKYLENEKAKQDLDSQTSKVCCRCKVRQPLSEFYWITAKNKHTFACKICMRERSKEIYDTDFEQRRKTLELARKRSQAAKSRNRLYIKEYLQTHPCVDCGLADWVVLEFDHVRGKKIRNVTLMTERYSLQALIDEIAKCDVRCCNCHRRVTFERSDNWRLEL